MRTSELAAELEHHGLIDVETVQRIACDATVVVAVDDSAGHTMYEGRARRFPSGAQRREIIRRDRHCRFPGCTNATFAVVHHIGRGNPAVAPTCPTWCCCANSTMGWCTEKGGPSRATPIEELSIKVPNGRVMVSRPSPLWARVTADRRSAGLRVGRPPLRLFFVWLAGLRSVGSAAGLRIRSSIAARHVRRRRLTHVRLEPEAHAVLDAAEYPARHRQTHEQPRSRPSLSRPPPAAAGAS